MMVAASNYHSMALVCYPPMKNGGMVSFFINEFLCHFSLRFIHGVVDIMDNLRKAIQSFVCCQNL